MSVIKRLVLVVALLLAAVIVYLLVAPVAITPGAWNPPTAPPLTGQYAQNSLLKVYRLDVGQGHKPEDVAILSRRLYVGFEDGRIIQHLLDSRIQPHIFANTSGRPLGMAFDSAGNLIVADAIKGLLLITPKSQIESLSTGIDGRTYGCLNDLDIAADGTIYFTEASSKYPMSAFATDIIEHQPNGRLLAYDPKTLSVRVVLDGLYFANGVALSPDQSFVLVAETGKYRIRKVWLTGEKKGQVEDLISNLPGFPDGISSNGKDKFWVALVTPRSPFLDLILPYPFLRKVVFRLPKFLHPAPKRYSFVISVDKDGRVIDNFQDGSPDCYAQIANVVENDGELFFGSIGEDTVGRFRIGPPAER